MGRFPSMQFDVAVYLDDIVANIVGKRCDIVNNMAELAEAMDAVVRDEVVGFGAALALDMLAITGSSETVVQLLRRRLGKLAGPDQGVNVAAVNLGIDYRPGQARGRVKKGQVAAAPY